MSQSQSELAKLVERISPKYMNAASAGELAAFFGQLPPDTPVMVLDGWNGGGNPRFLNYGPCVELIKKETNGDTHFIVGQEVVVLGYGCY